MVKRGHVMLFAFHALVDFSLQTSPPATQSAVENRNNLPFNRTQPWLPQAP